MFIGFPAIVSEWIKLSSVASSLKNDEPRRNAQVNKPYRTKEGCGLFKIFA